MRVGIDLGTTNSLVAAWIDGAPQLVPNALGAMLTPSAVSIDRDGNLLVGQAALDRQTVDPQSTATSFKRFMGTKHQAKLGSRTLTPEELSSRVLAALKADAEAQLGEAVTSAVITVPAYFNDRQRKATRRAGELADLKVDRLINEPTAAALAFGIQDRAEREPFLVFDLGGGTFDVSIVEMFDGVMEVRASAGDNRLGGDDFNDALVTLATPHLNIDERLTERQSLLVAERLRAAAERTRRALTNADTARFSLVVKGAEYGCDITATEFETQVAGLIARLREPVLRALRDSRIRAEELSDLILVGGATRMPAVRKAIATMFGRFPNHGVHPDEAVALGAAVQAGLLSRDAALDEIRMTDICPYTLGIAHGSFDSNGMFNGGLMSPIIERSTPIPASRSEVYSTVVDRQKGIDVEIYQGEARLVADNVALGKIEVPVPKRPAGEASIECRFTYDSSGLLEVDVTVPLTGKTHNLVIFDDGDAIDPGEFKARRAALAALKVHPRDQGENIALTARAERAYEDFLGDRRETVGRLIQNFKDALASQDPRAIAEMRQIVAAHLDELESERYL